MIEQMTVAEKEHWGPIKNVIADAILLWNERDDKGIDGPSIVSTIYQEMAANGYVSVDLHSHNQKDEQEELRHHLGVERKAKK